MALHIIDCISNYWALTLLAPIRRKNFFFRLSSPRSAPSQLLAEWTCNNVNFFLYLVHVLSFRKHITFFHNRQSWAVFCSVRQQCGIKRSHTLLISQLKSNCEVIYASRMNILVKDSTNLGSDQNMHPSGKISLSHMD